MILQTRNVRRILERFVICQDTLHNMLRLCQLIGAVTSCCSAPWSACVLLGWFHGVPKVLLLKCTDPVNLNWNLFWGKTHNINSGQALLDDLLCNDGRFCSFFYKWGECWIDCLLWSVQFETYKTVFQFSEGLRQKPCATSTERTNGSYNCFKILWLLWISHEHNHKLLMGLNSDVIMEVH